MILYRLRADSPVVRGHRLLPICCPTGADPDPRDTIRIAHLHYPGCVSWRADDLRLH
jgi:hypothetical protein